MKTAYVIRTRTCFGSGAVAHAGWAVRGVWHSGDRPMNPACRFPQLEDFTLPGEGIA